MTLQGTFVSSVCAKRSFSQRFNTLSHFPEGKEVKKIHKKFKLPARANLKTPVLLYFMYTSNYSHFNNLLFTDIFRYKGDVPDAEMARGRETLTDPPHFF